MKLGEEATPKQLLIFTAGHRWETYVTDKEVSVRDSRAVTVEAMRLLVAEEMTSLTKGNTNLAGNGGCAESSSLFTVFSNENGSTKEGLVRELGFGSLGFLLRRKLHNTVIFHENRLNLPTGNTHPQPLD